MEEGNQQSGNSQRGHGKRKKNLFEFREFTIHQEHCAMKVGTDGVVLAGLTALDRPRQPELHQILVSNAQEKPFHPDQALKPPAYHDDEPKNVLDIGCGSGVISIFQAFRYSQAHVDAVDIDETAIQQTKINVDLLAEEVKSRILVHHTPIQEFRSDRSYDQIVCASPYFKSKAQDPYVMSMKDNRRLARHLHSLSLQDLLDVVKQYLNPDGGVFTTILPNDEVSEELESLLRSQQRIRCDEIISMRDNPTSKVIRKIFVCSIRKSSTDDGDPVLFDLPVYAKSYKEDPRIHRFYSDSYKHLLYPYCRHFDAALAIPEKESESTEGGQE